MQVCRLGEKILLCTLSIMDIGLGWAFSKAIIEIIRLWRICFLKLLQNCRRGDYSHSLWSIAEVILFTSYVKMWWGNYSRTFVHAEGNEKEIVLRGKVSDLNLINIITQYFSFVSPFGWSLGDGSFHSLKLCKTFLYFVFALVFSLTWIMHLI